MRLKGAVLGGGGMGGGRHGTFNVLKLLLIIVRSSGGIPAKMAVQVGGWMNNRF